MKKFKIIIFCIIIIILQTTICQYIKIGGIIPDLLFVFVVCFAMFEPSFVYTIIVSMALGLIFDMLGGQGMGMHSLIYGYTAVMCYGVSKYFLGINIFIALVATFIACFVGESAVFIFSYTIFGESNFILAIKQLILPSSIYNTLICSVMYLFVKRVIYYNRRYI